MHVKLNWLCVAFASCLLLHGCASIGPPGGGPEDGEPPQIVEVSPPPGSTGVDPKAVIEFTFSEPIDRESLLEALFISPAPLRKPRVKTRGRRVRLVLREPVPGERTLVVSIGSGVMDLHRNRLAQSYTLALTAGERIDDGRISGRVFARQSLQGILVGAWIVSDSLDMNPIETPAEFLTQTGEDGKFALDYLPPGDFRVACWDDRNHDRLYDPGADRIGLPWRDVRLDSGSEAWIELYAVKRDTSEAALFIVSASDDHHVVLRFSSELRRSTADVLPELSVYDSSGALEVQRAWLDAADSSRMVLLTEKQVADGVYFLTLAGDTTRYSFSGSSIPDTLGPRVAASFPAGRERGIPETPAGWIGFDDALSVTDFDSLLTLFESDGSETPDSVEIPDSLKYPLSCHRIESNLVQWESLKKIPFGAELTLQLDLTRIRDKNGNLSPDSTWDVSFSVIDPAETGSISGKVSGNVARPIVMARSLRGRDGADTRGSASGGGLFKIERLNTGDYLIWAFDDMDRDGSYDPGALKPFRFAERFTVVPDTITVRERWETGGVKVTFR